jgi:hypothetical protein
MIKALNIILLICCLVWSLIVILPEDLLCFSIFIMASGIFIIALYLGELIIILKDMKEK